MDAHYPSEKKGFATIVWFHGGGLQQGNKSITKQLKNQSMELVAANYRLFPKVKCPTLPRGRDGDRFAPLASSD